MLHYVNSLINLASVFACLLRSPFVHHCHPNPFHLKQFAKYHQYTGATYGKYKRPQRDMFMDHTHQQIHDYNLNMCHRQGRLVTYVNSNHNGSLNYKMAHF